MYTQIRQRISLKKKKQFLVRFYNRYIYIYIILCFIQVSKSCYKIKLYDKNIRRAVIYGGTRQYRDNAFPFRGVVVMAAAAAVIVQVAIVLLLICRRLLAWKSFVSDFRLTTAVRSSVELFRFSPRTGSSSSSLSVEYSTVYCCSHNN